MAWGQTAWGPSSWGADGLDPSYLTYPALHTVDFMAKTQYLASEPLRLLFFPFFDTVNSQYITDGSDVATCVVKKPNDVLLSPAPTLVFDSDVKFWVAEVAIGDYMQGDWMVKAVSDAADTLPQFRVFTWGDYVDYIETLKKIGTGRWRVDTVSNTLKLYDENGTSVLFEFDTKDAAGNPTSTDIFERDPV